jgi:hypothetical protein
VGLSSGSLRRINSSTSGTALATMNQPGFGAEAHSSEDGQYSTILFGHTPSLDVTQTSTLMYTVLEMSLRKGGRGFLPVSILSLGRYSVR